MRALGRLGVTYHDLQHAYTSTGASTRSTTSGGNRDGVGSVSDSSGSAGRIGGGGGGGGGGLSAVLTLVSPHLSARSLSTLLHGLSLLAANANTPPSGNGNTPTTPTTTPPPPEFTLDTHGQGLNRDTQGQGLGPGRMDGIHVSTPPPLVALPPAIFRALFSSPVTHALTPQGVALVVYSLGKLGYTWNQLDDMGVPVDEVGESGDDMLRHFYDHGHGHDNGDDYDDRGVQSTDKGDPPAGGVSGIPTPPLTKSLLSAIAREAPRMNAQVQGLAKRTRPTQIAP